MPLLSLLRHILSGPAWPLPTFLLFAGLLRLPAVLWADGYEFVDQQFQYVEPAWHLATGQPWQPTWEWLDHMRSWVYPGALAGMFRAGLWLGIDEPLWLMRVVRLLHALLSLLPLWWWWLLLVEWRPSAAPRLPLLAFAGSGLLVYCGTQPSGPTAGATLAIAAALAVHGPRWFPWLGGLCLGLAFCCRPQEALFGPALLAVLLVQRRRAAALAFAGGCLPGILLQGFVDLADQGRFLGSVWNYFAGNVLQGSAAKWDQHGPHWYWLCGVAPLLVLLPGCWGAAWQRLRLGAAVVPGALAAGLLHLAVHSLICRKALRFEYGALALLFAVLLAGYAQQPVARAAERWHLRGLALVHGGALLLACLWFGHAGAIRAALAIREQGVPPAVLVVDGDASTLGGFYYLRWPAAVALRSSPRRELAAALQQAPLPDGAVVIAPRTPLEPGAVAAIGRLEPCGAHTGWLDLRRGDRRFVYRFRARG